MQSTDDGKKKPQGFGSLSPEEHKKVASKGGSWKGKKGTAVLSQEERSERASKMAKARWAKVREERQQDEEN